MASNTELRERIGMLLDNPPEPHNILAAVAWGALADKLLRDCLDALGEPRPDDGNERGEGVSDGQKTRQALKQGDALPPGAEAEPNEAAPWASAEAEGSSAQSQAQVIERGGDAAGDGGALLAGVAEHPGSPALGGSPQTQPRGEPQPPDHRGVVELLPDGVRIRCETCVAAEYLRTYTGVTPEEWGVVRSRFDGHTSRATVPPLGSSATPGSQPPAPQQPEDYDSLPQWVRDAYHRIDVAFYHSDFSKDQIVCRELLAAHAAGRRAGDWELREARDATTPGSQPQDVMREAARAWIREQSQTHWARLDYIKMELKKRRLLPLDLQREIEAIVTELAAPNECITDPGWYWYETEYPDEGSCGPFDTRAEALASGLGVHNGDAEHVGVFYFRGALATEREGK